MLDQFADSRKHFSTTCARAGRISSAPKYEVLLYDLTSTYFEGATPRILPILRRHSATAAIIVRLPPSRDRAGRDARRFSPGLGSDAGNTPDKTTLPGIPGKIETLYGQAHASGSWIAASPPRPAHQNAPAEPPVHYLVGTPRARQRQTRAQWENLPWQKVKDSVEVKLFREGTQLYVVAKSGGRQAKEIAIRRKKLARLLWTLRGMRRETSRDRLLLRLGAAKAKAGRAAALVEIHVPAPASAPKKGKPQIQKLTPGSFTFQLKKAELKAAELYDGHYLPAQQSQRQRAGVVVETLHAVGGD